MSTQAIWIDAAEFTDYGGWKLDTQFIDTVGQAYLLACDRPGTPVQSAKTNFQIKQAGMYRVWVRCKNWYYPYQPGLFQLAIDDEAFAKDLGNQPSHEWTWQLVGDRHFSTGTHRLEAKDLTGYFGRFAAIYITSDFDFVPQRSLESFLKLREISRGIETLRNTMNFDVVVVGGGPGGVPAALAAARNGQSTLLITNRPVLGGNGSEEIGVFFNGAGARHPEAREGGIMEEILRTKGYRNCTWSAAMAELCAAEKHLTVLLNWHVLSAQTQNQKITHIEAKHCTKAEYLLISGKYFIDASGDGVLIASSGAKYRQGREAYWQHQEAFAPEQPDQMTMSGCVFRAKFTETSAPVKYDPPEWIQRLPEGKDIGRNIEHIGPTWWNEADNQLNDVDDAELARDELFRVMLAYFDYLKNLWEEKERAANYAFTYMPHLLAKRESRRMVGTYILTQNDCQSGKTFPDVIGYSGWPIDLHHPRGIYSGIEGPYAQNAHVPIVQIPYGCIISANIENLFASGRNISVSHVALGTSRLQSTIANLAQAVGTAAALCTRLNLSPRDLGEQQIHVLQQQLLREDIWLPGIKYEDPTDLATHADITASSYSTNEELLLVPGTPSAWLALDRWRACFVPRGLNTDIPKIYLLLRNDNPHAIALKLHVQVQADPDAFLEEQSPLTAEAVLQPGEHWLEFPVNLHTDLRYLYAYLEPTPGVFWRSQKYPGLDWSRSERQTSTERFENIRWEAQMLLLEAPSTLALNCHPSTVRMGNSRGINPEAYGWVSDPEQELPQWIQVTFPTEQTIQTIEITFDSDFNSPAIPVVVPKQPAKLVTEYIIEYWQDKKWKPLKHIQDNYFRKRTHQVENLKTQALRLSALATGGDRSARIFSIRIF